MQEEQVKLLNKQEAAMKRERALAYAFSHQVCVPCILLDLRIVCRPNVTVLPSLKGIQSVVL